MAKLTFVSFGSSTASFAATGTAAATVLPPRPFEYLNEAAAVSERLKGERIWFDCNDFDRRHVPYLHYQLTHLYEGKGLKRTG